METIHWHALTPEQRDRIIAERVMNWQERQCDGEWAEVSGGWFCTKCGHDGNWGDSFEHAALPPRYSQSMDAAWLVVERVIQPPQTREEAIRFSATQFSFWFEKAGLWACTRQEAANEICIAALRALGYEVLTEEVKAVE